MIKITLYHKGRGQYQKLVCSGHSGYGRAGSDIVCAAVSMLVINTLNAMERFGDMKMNQSEKDGYLEAEFLSAFNERSGVLMKALIMGVEDVHRQYGGKYITYEIKEVALC